MAFYYGTDLSGPRGRIGTTPGGGPAYYPPSTFSGSTPAPPAAPSPPAYTGGMTGTFTQTQAPTQQKQQPQINLGNLDFSNDPILARIRALGQESISHAEAEAQAARTKLVIGYGDTALAKKLGLGGKTLKQAGENPFSTLAELKRTYERRNVFDIDRPLSDQHNLFYSTERGRQRALSTEQDLRDRAQAGNTIQERLTEIQNGLIQARMSNQANLIQGQQDAYQRALQLALYSAGASA